ncbi:UNKNOWN [Stylonychia lemnae]|uniref:Uncharacterized protein n=1 Tax=Stylonychia lemnae TaxID=5949 RepID=A0A078AAF7_STYLE|nr:UNKNOWN [Stylonychia lemnae]|eukprot:CDW79250.1 UNKNOWN [Stylonychia lemnae]
MKRKHGSCKKKQPRHLKQSSEYQLALERGVIGLPDPEILKIYASKIKNENSRYPSEFRENTHNEENEQLSMLNSQAILKQNDNVGPPQIDQESVQYQYKHNDSMPPALQIMIPAQNQ